MKHEEDTLQMACVRWFSYQYAELALLLHHSPNGGKRNAREGARFKQMGVRAGFPDLILCVARNGYHGLFLELKTEKGRLTDNQKSMHEELLKQGYKVVVVRSVEDFITEIKKYL